MFNSNFHPFRSCRTGCARFGTAKRAKTTKNARWPHHAPPARQRGAVSERTGAARADIHASTVRSLRRDATRGPEEYERCFLPWYLFACSKTGIFASNRGGRPHHDVLPACCGTNTTRGAIRRALRPCAAGAWAALRVGRRFARARARKSLQAAGEGARPPGGVRVNSIALSMQLRAAGVAMDWQQSPADGRGRRRHRREPWARAIALGDGRHGKAERVGRWGRSLPTEPVPRRCR